METIKSLLASRNATLTLFAFKLIGTGLGIIALLIASGILTLSIATINAIALGIKLLNEWCDRQSAMMLNPCPMVIAMQPVRLAGLLAAQPVSISTTDKVMPHTKTKVSEAKLAQTLFSGMDLTIKSFRDLKALAKDMKIKLPKNATAANIRAAIIEANALQVA